MSECPPTGPEVRAWVATEIMGWHESGRFWKYNDDDTYTGLNTGQSQWNTQFRPDIDRNHTALMEDRLEEMGNKVWGQYLLELYRNVFKTSHPETEPHCMLVMAAGVRASAYDRVRAAWAVIGEKK